MHRDDLDFIATRSALTPLGGVLLVAGIVLSASLFFDVSDSFQQRRSAQEKLAQLTVRIAELRGSKAAQVRKAATPVGKGALPDERETRRIADAQAVIRALTVPWNELFNALEAAQDDQVALLSITPERATSRLALAGEARNFESLTDYLARLDSGEMFKQTQLLSHDVKGNDRHIVFSASSGFGK